MMTSEFLGSEFVSETDKTVINMGHANSKEFSVVGGWVVRLKDPLGILRGPVLTSLFPVLSQAGDPVGGHHTAGEERHAASA